MIDRPYAYQRVFGVEVAERAQHPGGGVQVLVLLQQLGEPEVRDLGGAKRIQMWIAVEPRYMAVAGT